MKIEWREIPGYPDYRVNNLGVVESRLASSRHSNKAEWHPLSIQPTKYPSVVLCRNGIHKTRTVHTLVLEAFIGPKPKGMEACHCNGNRADNRLSNLRWDTPAANNQDKIAHGTVGIGERNTMSKLTEEKVKHIHYLLASGDISQAEIARRMGVTPMTISRIKHGETWSHVLVDIEVKS